MGRNLTKEELKRHKEKALAKMEHYIDSLINSPDSKTSLLFSILNLVFPHPV